MSNFTDRRAMRIAREQWEETLLLDPARLAAASNLLSKAEILQAITRLLRALTARGVDAENLLEVLLVSLRAGVVDEELLARALESL